MLSATSHILYIVFSVLKINFPGKGLFPQCLSVPKNHGLVVWDNDAGPLVNHGDEEESWAQDGHQEEGPKKHPIQNLGYKFPILDHLKKNKQTNSVLEKLRRFLTQAGRASTDSRCTPPLLWSYSPKPEARLQSHIPDVPWMRCLAVLGDTATLWSGINKGLLLLKRSGNLTLLTKECASWSAYME